MNKINNQNKKIKLNKVTSNSTLNKTVNLKKWIGILGKGENRVKEFKKSIKRLRQHI